MKNVPWPLLIAVVLVIGANVWQFRDFVFYHKEYKKKKNSFEGKEIKALGSGSADPQSPEPASLFCEKRGPCAVSQDEAANALREDVGDQQA